MLSRNARDYAPSPLRSRLIGPTALTGTTPVTIAPGNGARVAIVVSFASGGTPGASGVVHVMFGQDGTSRATVMLSLHNPNVILSYDDIGDIIREPVSATTPTVVASLQVTEVLYVPEGSR